MNIISNMTMSPILSGDTVTAANAMKPSNSLYSMMVDVQAHHNGALTHTGSFSVSGAFNETIAPTITAASVIDIGAISGNYVDISGTTNITRLGSGPVGAERILHFINSAPAGGASLIYSASYIILPGNVDIVTFEGDIAVFRCVSANKWVCTSYQSQLYSPGNVPLADNATSASSLGGIGWNYWPKLPSNESSGALIQWGNILSDGTVVNASTTVSVTASYGGVSGKYMVALSDAYPNVNFAVIAQSRSYLYRVIAEPYDASHILVDVYNYNDATRTPGGFHFITIGKGM